jgi:hypothetical protein
MFLPPLVCGFQSFKYYSVRKNMNSLVLQCLWLCNNRFLLRCDLLFEGSPPQHFRLFSLSFYSLSTVYSVRVEFNFSSLVSLSVSFCIFVRMAFSLKLRNHPSTKIYTGNLKIYIYILILFIRNQTGGYISL